MSCYNKKIPFIYVLILSILVSSCVDHSNPKMFQDNINKFNDFSQEEASEEERNKLIVFSDPANDLENNLPKCKKASIAAKDIKLAHLSKLLGDAYDANISYALNPERQNKEKSTDIADVLEINFKDMCLSEVLDELTDIYDIGVAETSSGYQLYHADTQTITYELNYHNFQRKGNSSISISSSQLSNDNKTSQNYSTIISESEDKFWGSIKDAISSILNIKTNQQDQKENNANDFYVYKEAGLIVVTATPKQHKNIRTFLRKANINSVRQVMIEAKILEVELNDQFNTGIQWDALKGKLRQSAFARLKNSSDSSGSSDSSDSSDSYNSLSAVHNTANLTHNEGVTIGSSMFSSGMLKSGNSFNLIMQALGSQGKVSVLSSPRVSALNNQRALIKSGEDKYFVTNVSNTEVNTGSTTSSTSRSSFNIEPLFAGIALDTTPTVINNSEILLHIHPMISRIKTDENSKVTINGQVTDTPRAVVKIREVDTVVKARSGDIIILGGMTEDYVSLSKSQLPLTPPKGLGKIFDLFSSKQNYSTKKELIILMKPTIVEGSGASERLGKLGTYNGPALTE